MSTLLKLLLLLSPLLLSSCYYTAQSYNNGKTLNPGDAEFSFGYGGSRHDINFTNTEYYNNENNIWVEDSSHYNGGYYLATTTYSDNFFRNFAFQMNLGILDKYPFGGGMEIGLHLEAQYSRYQDYDELYGSSKRPFSNTIPAIDFSGKFGFKDIVLSNSQIVHNVDLGWTTGMWLDNGFFFGYALGVEFLRIIPYLNVRGIIMPTNILESESFVDEDDFFQYHDQKWNIRTAIGATVKIPELIIIPDEFTPELTITGPNGFPGEKVSINFHIGLTWSNGL
jgi:hypothetical protein